MASTETQTTAADFLLRQLRLLKRIGSPAQRAEVPYWEEIVEKGMGTGGQMAASFATGKKDKTVVADMRVPETAYKARHTDDPAVDMLLDTIDSVRQIAGIHEINGPAGALLGRRLVEAQIRKGRFVRDFTVRELTEICEDASREYNARARQEASA